jgi:hypothetical protein
MDQFTLVIDFCCDPSPTSYSAVLDLVALPSHQITPAIYALVPRLPRPPEATLAAVDQSAQLCSPPPDHTLESCSRSLTDVSCEL